MAPIAFYLSDHGFGHATRAVALMRALLAAGRLSLVVRSGARAALVERALAPWVAAGRVRVVPGATHVGLVPAPGSFEVDRERTRRAVAGEMAALAEWVERERALCRREGVRLVVSDTVPGAFPLAASFGVPGLAVGNFSWYDLYADLFPRASWLAAMREAHACAAAAAVLPFAAGVTAFPRAWEAPLLARSADPRRAAAIRREAAGSAARPVVYVGLGGSFPDAGRVAAALFAGGAPLPEAAFIAGRGLGGALPGALAIPPDDPEGQDYLAAADVAVVKAGYGTVAEAVRARVPVVVLHRPGLAEDRAIAAEVERLGIGVAVPVIGGRVAGDLAGAVAAALDRRPAFARLPERYATDGAGAIAGWIVAHLRRPGRVAGRTV